jgi:hypothetical protein
LLCNFADTLKKSHMENNKKNKLYYVSTADLIKLMNDVMNADKKSASEIIGIDEENNEALANLCSCVCYNKAKFYLHDFV